MKEYLKESKFKYGDNVTIVKGFYRGLTGQVIDYDKLLFLYTVSIDNSWHYRIVKEEELELRSSFFQRLKKFLGLV